VRWRHRYRERPSRAALRSSPTGDGDGVAARDEAEVMVAMTACRADWRAADG
jgi:hypothetical protein